MDFFLSSPDIFVKDKVLQDKPGAVDDDQEGETSKTRFPLINLANIDQSSGDVDQAGNDAPGGVDSETIEDELVDDTPPEQRSALLKLMLMLEQIPGEEGDDKHVGDSDADEDHRGEDCEVGVSEGSVPDEDPGEVQKEVG